MRYCPSCEAELADYSHFCRQCGYALDAPTTIDKAQYKKQSFPEDELQQEKTVVLRNLPADRYKKSTRPLDGVAQEYTFVLPRRKAVEDKKSTRPLDGVEQEDTVVLRGQQVVEDKRSSTAKDVQQSEVANTGSRISTASAKVLNHLPMPVQRTLAAVLSRARDPQPEEFPTSHPSDQKADGSQAITWRWLPLLTLTSALGTLSVAYAYTSARYGATDVDIFFWLGILLIFVPPMVRLISPAPSRFERISLLCVVGMCFYLSQLLFSPLAFIPHDPFIHWRTTSDITSSGHLFTVNTLLPASPFYPGLEIMTNALTTLSGLSIFHSAIIVLGVARLVTVLSLFMLFELIMKSARMAGIATAFYMTNPHFLFFDASFSYESLALPLALFMLFTMARHEILDRDNRWTMLITWIALGAVVITHHLTSYIFDGLLLLWVVIYALQKKSVHVFWSDLAKTALLGIVLSLAWVGLKGNPVVEYLSSYFDGALKELGQILAGTSSARHLFVNYSGQVAPLWERLMAISSVALIVLGLPFGLLCLWQRYRYNALVCMFGIASLFYPLSHVFRFTNFGGEIADRAAAFLFIPLACILTIFIVQFWPTRWLNWKQTSLITSAMAVVLLGGIVLAAGPPWSLLPGTYLVAADARSVEPEGIQTALWAHSYLGSNNRIAADRTNRLLMETYGNQYIVTSLKDNIDVTPVFFSPNFGPDEVSILRSANIRYLVVDLRLSQALPSLGFYFEPGEPGSFQRTAPVALQALTKFNTIRQINRVYDSGNIVIYDVGGLVNAPNKP